MQDFRNLLVWQKAHKLTLRIYRMTATFPDFERFGLANQMRRSAASIPTNLAEGCGRASRSDMARFLSMALGSANELHYQIMLATDLGYLPDEGSLAAHADVEEIKRMLTSLHKRLVMPRDAQAHDLTEN